MKKHLKVLLIISLIINLGFLVANYTPQYFSLGINHALDFNQLKVGGYVKGLNFEGVSSEFYLIFSGKTEYKEDGVEFTDYYYLNGLQTDGSIALSGLKQLEIKSIDESQIVLFDDMYTFEVYKTGKVLGKDRNGEMFELSNIIKF